MTYWGWSLLLFWLLLTAGALSYCLRKERDDERK